MLIDKQINEAIGTITLDAPERRNALSRTLVGELLVALDELRSAGARVVILRARPEVRVWSAGHDLDELPAGEDPLLYSDPLEQLLRAIASFPAPVVAMVHGSVWGGATDLVLTCDIVVGDESSSFAITPANLGLAFNTTGLLHFLRRLPLNLVKEMFFTAEPVTAADAARWGLLNHLLPADRLEPFTLELARRMASRAPLVISTVKEQLRLLAQSAPLSPDAFERIQELRRLVYRSDDYVEGLRAFHEHRPPVFRGI